MTDVVSLGTNSATRGPGDRSGSWRSWSKPYERPVDRPAPTVDGKALTAWAVHPAGTRDATLTTTAYRPTVDDLAVLQGFPRGYPWRGTRMEQGRQVGDAMPPPLATAILAAVRKDESVLIEDVEAIDLCAGPGGWDEGARMLDPELHSRIVGIEWDDAACLTREAAGHRTLKGDIAEVVPLTFRGCKGLIASPPCTLFSQAGSGIGRELIALLSDAIWRILHGEDCRAEVREAVYPTCHAGQVERNRKRVEAGKKPWTPEQIEKQARADAYIACLVLEPARYVHDLDESLEWLAFEQVPAVLPLWKLYVTALRKMGWSAWTGILNAADYGVPQTRERAILIARRAGAAEPPAATHAEKPVDDLFSEALPKWVSMADALGWGMTRRPSTTLPGTTLDPVTGKGRGGPRALDGGSGARETVRREYEAGHWTGRDLPWIERPDVEHVELRRGGDRIQEGFDPRTEPAQTVTTRVDRWQLVAGDHRDRATIRDEDEPAPTLHFGNAAANWKWLSVEVEPENHIDCLVDCGWPGCEAPRPEPPQVVGMRTSVSDQGYDKARDRGPDEPAATVTGKHRSAEWVVNTGRDWKPGGTRADAQRIPLDEPAPAVDTRGRWWVERLNDQTGTEVDLSWPEDRPATVIASRGLVTHPGANANRFNGSTKSRNDGLRVTAQEAGVLQAFPADYPWRGNRTKVFEQIGNAIPPLLAAHVVAAALGRTYTGL